MKLTEQQIADNAAAYVAYMSGRPVERKKADDSWLIETNPVNTWDMETFCRRPAPIPEPPKPWDCADDVPGPVCWIRICGEHRLVIAIDADGLTIGCNLTGQTNTHIAWVEFGQQIAKWEHSTDRKEWKPCVKKVK